MTGMGGSYAARYPGLIRLGQHGVPAFGINAAQLLHYQLNALNERTLLLLVSQSGESVEALRLAEAWRGRGILLALTNEGANTLSRLADISLQFRAGREDTVATKTFVCTLAALTLITGALVGEDLDTLTDALEQAVAAVRVYLTDWETRVRMMLGALAPDNIVTLLGRGASLSSAVAGGLILKEAAHVSSEGMSAAEYRHGPIEASGPTWPVILFIPAGRAAPNMERLTRELLDYGTRVVVIGPRSPDARALHLVLPALDEMVSPVAEIVPIQTLAYRWGRQRDLEPGQFRRIGKVITVE
jgi:glucosamine--fructose-6-phosphate aminotransferase (isomerizing)